MNCQACGVEVNSQAMFCHKCGERIEPEGTSEVGEQSSPHASAAEVSDRGAQQPTQPFQPRGGEDDPEAELWEGGYSAKAMVGQWLLGGMVTLLLIIGGVVSKGNVWLAIFGVIALLWIGLALLLLYRRWSVSYRLTTQRFIHQSGILRRVTDRIEVIDMDDITFEQGIVQRMVGVGTICISSSDRTHPELRLVGIDKVEKVADMIDSARRVERVRRGVHIEAV